jgi:spermidine synthase
MSWRELTPTYWFGLAFVAAAPLIAGDFGSSATGRIRGAVNGALLGLALTMVHILSGSAIWSPYYKITVQQRDTETVVEVNNIFHQSMARVDTKEYFYQWPYMAFGNTFKNVLILGAGSGTDVAAALHHGVQHVDAVEIDPVIIRLGRQWHPDRPYDDPRVTVINDDARHFLRTSNKKYDLVVFALIDSLTLQSSFSGVRLESYMFTEESFREVRDHLTGDGVLVIYNYFRERWLVDRLANTAAAAFGEEPYVHVNEARAYLGVLMAGPRLHQLTAPPVVPDRVLAFGQSHAPSPARTLARDPSVEPATDDWPFLYMRDRHLPGHYGAVIAMILAFSAIAVFAALRVQPGDQGHRGWSWQFFLLGAGFMLLETKAIIQFALLWGSTWVVASLAIASVLGMALAANFVVARREIQRPEAIGAALVGLLLLNYAIPIGRIGFENRALESLFYALLEFSPILCAGLLFGSAIKRSTSVARDYGVNLLGAMVGGVAEYASLVTGFRLLLLVIAACYVGAVLARRAEGRRAIATRPVII